MPRGGYNHNRKNLFLRGKIMDIQWYPGHMAKAKRLLAEKIKLVDTAVVVTDARAPLSTFNPDIPKLLSGKSFIVLLNKADLADEEMTALWERHYKEKYGNALSFSAIKSHRRALIGAINAASLEAVRKYAAKGMKKTVRALVCGVPNAGKSAVINRLIGKNSAATADKPGVTKGLQWLKVTDGLELLDSPGLLWPKIESEDASENLAIVGCIRQEITDTVALSLALIEKLKKTAPGALRERYGAKGGDPRDVLEQICANRGFLVKNGGIDFERGARTLLNEFRGGRLGRITLESPHICEEQ